MNLRRGGALWGHRDFLNLWAGETISQVGTQIALIALPLVAILELDASAFEVSLLTAFDFLPFLLFSLPAGVWVDRLRRRPILVLSDVGARRRARLDPDRRRARLAHDLAAVRGRLRRRRADGRLRRRLPVVPALADRARTAGRGQLEARALALRRADLRSRARRDPRLGADRAVRGRGRRRSATSRRPFSCSASAPSSRRPRGRRSGRCGQSSGRGSATSSATHAGGASRGTWRRSTSSRRSSSPC